MSNILNTLRVVSSGIIKPPYVFILIGFIIVFYSQNKKLITMQRMIVGEKLNTAFELTVSQVVLGVFAGAIASILLGYFGVAFNENTSIELIFLISIMLMFISPKYMCFSYSGAILGFISILLEIMRRMYGIQVKGLSFLNIDIPSLIMLIAVLHIVEGILIMLDGSKGSIPVFTKKDNMIIGGFALKRYWALPIVLVLIINSNMHSLREIIQFSNWSVLFKFSTPMDIIKNAAIMLIPFYGVIGYSGVTFTRTKKQKSLNSGFMILFYGITLFLVARVATLNIFFKLFAVIYAPAAHELMIYIEKYMEVIKKPKYVSNENGIMILEVAPNSPASKMGIKSGDVLLEVNDKKVFKEDDIVNIIKEASNFAWFKIKRATGKLEEIRYKNINEFKRLGVVFVPISVPKHSMVVKVNETKFGEVLEKMKNKHKS